MFLKRKVGFINTKEIDEELWRIHLLAPECIYLSLKQEEKEKSKPPGSRE